MFGLYKTVKDNTEFNLRAWINVETDNSQRLTTSNGEEKVEIKTVYALKPYYKLLLLQRLFLRICLRIMADRKTVSHHFPILNYIKATTLKTVLFEIE